MLIVVPRVSQFLALDHTCNYSTDGSVALNIKVEHTWPLVL